MLVAELRHGVHQGLRVGVQRALEQGARGGQLDDLPGIHHGHAVGDVAHDAEVVRDEQDAHAQALLELAEQLEDLRLDGHVQRGGRLVGHEELRFAGQRHRNHDALLHAAGHLVRVVADARFGRGDADEFQQADDLVVGGELRAMELQRFLDLVADAEDGVERGTGFLEDVADHAAADGAQFALVHLQHVAAVEENLAADVARGRRGHEARDGESGNALAAAALADEAERLAFRDGEGHAVHGAQGVRAGAEFELKVFDFEEGHSFYHKGTKDTKKAETGDFMRASCPSCLRGS